MMLAGNNKTKYLPFRNKSSLLSGHIKTLFEINVNLLTDLKVSPEEHWFDLLGLPADGPEQCKCKNKKHTKHLYKKLYNISITMLYSLTT